MSFGVDDAQVCEVHKQTGMHVPPYPRTARCSIFCSDFDFHEGLESRQLSRRLRTSE